MGTYIVLLDITLDPVKNLVLVYLNVDSSTSSVIAIAIRQLALELVLGLVISIELWSVCLEHVHVGGRGKEMLR